MFPPSHRFNPHKISSPRIRNPKTIGVMITATTRSKADLVSFFTNCSLGTVGAGLGPVNWMGLRFNASP